MIKEIKQLSMAEASEYIDKDETKVLGFIKRFTKLKPKEAKALREKLEKLNLMKVNDDNIAKIIDLLPENEVDLNKIFIDVVLDEDETKKILETVKEFI